MRFSRGAFFLHIAILRVAGVACGEFFVMRGVQLRDADFA